MSKQLETYFHLSILINQTQFICKNKEIIKDDCINKRRLTIQMQKRILTFLKLKSLANNGHVQQKHEEQSLIILPLTKSQQNVFYDMSKNLSSTTTIHPLYINFQKLIYLRGKYIKSLL